MNTIPNEEDFIQHIREENCPRYGQLLDDVKNHKQTKLMLKRIDADLEKTLFEELRKLTGMHKASTEEMHHVCNYLYWAHSSGLDLNFFLN